MGIGIGGSLGPFRAGVSTRGVGGGIGPVSAGTGWGGGGFILELLLWTAALTAIAWAAVWPFVVGKALARHFAAQRDSPWEVVTGTALEVIYVAAIAAVAWMIYSHRVHTRRLAQARELLVAMERKAAHAEGGERGCRSILKVLRRYPAGLAHEYAPQGERMLFAIAGMNLIEPRVESPGGPKRPTQVGEGDLRVTDKAVRILTDARTVEWRHDRIQETVRGVDYLLFRVSNRKTVTGVGGREEEVQLLEGLLLWSKCIGSDTAPAVDYFESLLRAKQKSSRERMAAYQEQLAFVDKLSKGQTALPAEA